MANFVVMRCEKLKGPGKLAVSSQHILRERECEHADPALKDQNLNWGNQSTEALMADWRNQLKQTTSTVRKDAVAGIEYVFAYTPAAEKMQTEEAQNAYFALCNEWIEKRHGKDRILVGSIHRDEVGGPHMHVIVVPLVERERDGKKTLTLSAKTFMDGGKKLAQAQTEVAMIGKPFGLERGIERSGARHKKVRRMYGMLDRPEIDQVRIPEKKLLENLEDYAKRIQKAVQKQFETAFAQIKEIAQSEKKRALELDKALSLRPSSEDLAFMKGERDRWQKRAQEAEKSIASHTSWVSKASEKEILAWAGEVRTKQQDLELKQTRAKDRGVERD